LALDTNEYFDQSFFDEDRLGTVYILAAEKATMDATELSIARKMKLRRECQPFAKIVKGQHYCPIKGIVVDLAKQPLLIIQHTVRLQRRKTQPPPPPPPPSPSSTPTTAYPLKRLQRNQAAKVRKFELAVNNTSEGRLTRNREIAERVIYHPQVSSSYSEIRMNLKQNKKAEELAFQSGQVQPVEHMHYLAKTKQKLARPIAKRRLVFISDSDEDLNSVDPSQKRHKSMLAEAESTCRKNLEEFESAGSKDRNKILRSLLCPEKEVQEDNIPSSNSLENTSEDEICLTGLQLVSESLQQLDDQVVLHENNCNSLFESDKERIQFVKDRIFYENTFGVGQRTQPSALRRKALITPDGESITIDNVRNLPQSSLCGVPLFKSFITYNIFEAFVDFGENTWRNAFQRKPSIPPDWLLRMQIDGMFNRSHNSSIIGGLKVTVNFPTDSDTLKQDSGRKLDDRCVLIYQNDKLIHKW
jgi:hypothetical protein